MISFGAKKEVIDSRQSRAEDEYVKDCRVVLTVQPIEPE